jgi:hypothetical protein
LSTKTEERIRELICEGVSLAGITSLIYVEKLEDGTKIGYMLMRKLIEKEICRIKQQKKPS